MSVLISDLTVQLGGAVVLDAITLDIGSAERVAIMGPSGAGKSTLLRTIAGLERPARGSILVNGMDVTELAPHERSVGLMFQDYALFPHLKVIDNVAYGLRMHGMRKQDAREAASGLLDLVGLRAFADRRTASLSGGEQQRVALARTLAPSPNIALFDEPLGSLDQELKAGLIEEMRRVVTALGTASIYVTHDREEAERYGERLAIMRRGRIVRVGTPAAIWEDPRTPFVARFIGHRNVVPGALVGHGGHVVLPMDAIAVDRDGDLGATVSESLFARGRYDIAAEIGDIRVTFTTDAHIDPGTSLRLTIDADRVMPLVRDEIGRADDPAELGGE